MTRKDAHAAMHAMANGGTQTDTLKTTCVTSSRRRRVRDGRGQQVFTQYALVAPTKEQPSDARTVLTCHASLSSGCVFSESIVFAVGWYEQGATGRGALTVEMQQPRTQSRSAASHAQKKRLAHSSIHKRSSACDQDTLSKAGVAHEKGLHRIRPPVTGATKTAHENHRAPKQKAEGCSLAG
jgi:hypothetical protein